MSERKYLCVCVSLSARAYLYVCVRLWAPVEQIGLVPLSGDQVVRDARAPIFYCGLKHGEHSQHKPT